MQKRNITVATILGAALLGSLVAWGDDSLPRPRPVAPPPEEVAPAPTADPAIVVPDVPNPYNPKNAPPAPAATPAPKPIPVPVPLPLPLPETPKKVEASAAPTFPPLPPVQPLPVVPDVRDVVKPAQFTEPKPLPPTPAVPDLPAPPKLLNVGEPKEAIKPPVMPEIPPAPPVAAPPTVPPPVIPPVAVPPVAVPPVAVPPVAVPPMNPSATAKPWTPGDTEIKTPDVPRVDITPIPPATKPPVAFPTSNPTEATPGTTSRFHFSNKQPAAPPSGTPPTPQPQPVAPEPNVGYGRRLDEDRSEQIPRFLMVRQRANPIPSKPPGPLKIQETSRPSGPVVQPGPELHTPAQDPALGALTPQLTVDKRGPLYHKVGGALKYQIVLRNVGTIAAQQVRVEDEVPGSQLLAATPMTTSQQGDRLVWILPSLRPGEERIFLEELQPLRSGDVVSATSVHVYASTSFRTKLDGEVIAPPSAGPTLIPNTPNLTPTPPLTPGPAVPVGPSLDPLPPPVDKGPAALTTPPPQPLTAAQIPMTVEVKALPIVGVGQKLVFEVLVTNKGATPLTGMMLYGKIPTGFAHPEGANIGADLPDIPVGETKSFKMPIMAVTPGKYTIEIRVTAKPYYELVARPVVTIEGKGFSIQQQTAAPRMQVGKENEIKILVANDQPTPISQVHIVDVLPDGLEFVGASDRGMYQSSSRTITWLLDTVPPGETRTVSLKVQPKSAGTYPHEVIARAHDAPETKSTSVYQVESFSTIRLEVAGRDPVLEEGKETVYQIRVTNLGTSMATNVQASVSLSAGLQPSGFAQAPTAYRINGNDVIFAPMPRLQAGETRTIHLGVRGTSSGQQSVRVQVVGDQLRTPITREERTQVYRDR